MGKIKRPKKPSTPSSISLHPNAFSIWVDGSHRPPDNAACAYLIFCEKKKDVIKVDRLAFRGATINQMELEAINHALDHPGMEHVVIHSDSMYSILCLSTWRFNWARNNWITPHGEPVKNKDLLLSIGRKLDALKSYQFVKVAAHTGERYNSLVDYLAATLTKRMRDDPSISTGSYIGDAVGR